MNFGIVFSRNGTTTKPKSGQQNTNKLSKQIIQTNIPKLPLWVPKLSRKWRSTAKATQSGIQPGVFEKRRMFSRWPRDGRKWPKDGTRWPKMYSQPFLYTCSYNSGIAMAINIEIATVTATAVESALSITTARSPRREKLQLQYHYLWLSRMLRNSNGSSNRYDAC